ncbi:hypothetical protein BU26DRAFT_284493 [Trematosphaeria pertusa]|uniref:2EXR domain-containing protein n=1 Tax=Trematosphaeria pertusa TaxID=390896 RepID=A0A6A6IM66_9PLEO|nr:uncharacterized protein BU26DRAFT_284493 [Trematosphaeria pertusa]KAF2251506.1 hypothetical protein BU26DRAFT_284493 [Trematosphaeria pertusa]
MATYATYWHPAASTMVHGGSTTYTAAAPTHPVFQLQLYATASAVPAAASEDADSAMPDVERESVPTGLSVAPPPNEQDESLFFRLPAELRNQVYVELLCPDAVKLKDLARRNRDKNLGVRHSNLHPAILSTCRKIHQEAQRLLYTHVFHAHPSLLTSLPHLTSKPVLYPSVTSLISRWHISLRLDTDPRFTFSQATAAFSSAEYLEIHVWQAQFEACDYSMLKLFTGVRGVKVARVAGSVDFELARWLEHNMMQPKEEEDVEMQGDICRCDDDACPGFEGKTEVVCGRCYRKGRVEWIEKEWDLWRFGAR